MAYGYIYVTTNLINGKKYIGKHEKSEYDKSYYGSGKLLLEDIKRFGIKNFLNEPLEFFDSVEELNAAERKYIANYRLKYDMYNIANGGDGGNVWKYSTAAEKQKFSEKMSIINSFRVQSQEFKNKTSKRMHEKYLSEAERKKQSEVVRKAWSDPILRSEQSKRLRKYYSNRDRDCSFNYKKMKLVFNNNTIIFNSRKETRKYFKENFNISLYSNTINTIIKETKEGTGWKPFHKNKYGYLTGLKLYYIEDVETNCDECNNVSRR